MLRRLGRVLWPYRGWVVLAFLLTLGVAVLGPLLPRLVQIAIDDYVTVGDSAGLLRIILLMVGVLVGEALLRFGQGYLTQWIGQNALYDLRTKVFRHIEHQRLAFFDRTPIGTLITRATNDIEALGDLVSSSLVQILGDTARLVFIGVFMLTLNFELGLVALAALPFMILATEIFRRKMRVAFRETRKQVARVNAFLQEHITGMSVVQIFGREAEEARRFRSVNKAHRDAWIKTVFLFALFWPVVDLISSSALGVVLWFGGTEAMRQAVTVGTLIAFVQYVRMFFEPVRNLSDQLNAIQSAMAASERIFNLLDDNQRLSEAERPSEIERVAGRIAFENVWFAYKQRESGEDGEEWDWVLRDVSFTVEPGETFALVGATGSGKTTIISLLMRFYEPQRGRITLDGVDIQEIPLQTLRSQLGLVLQDVFLFSGTIRENITLGDRSIPDKRIEEAARLAGADDFIRRQPDGYDTVLGERGASLSLGQRQLLSFVRTLLVDPAVLVLDEATASVDTETEEQVQRAIDVLMTGRTALVVAHRLSTIQHADTILVLHKGVIRERGNHQTLLREDGLYRRLYELQYAEQEAGFAAN